MTILRVLSFQAVCAVAFLVLFAVPASASERFALIIGNGSYGDGPLSPLKNPVNDAVLIGQTLERTGFQVDLVMDADLRGMKRAVSAFTQRLSSAGPDAIALFYFSGHGFQANNLNYLAPLGADLKDEVDAEFEAMSVDWVLAKLEAAHRGANVIILDACRNTALSRSFRTVGEGLAMMARTPAGSFISYATAPGSVAADGQGLNSPYSAAIAREIARPGLSLERAFKNVRRSVVAETAGAQVPWDYSSLTADIVLVRAGDPAATPQAQADASAGTLIELQLWNDVKDSGSTEALQAYLDRYPDGAFAALAKSRIRQLGSGGGDTAAQIQALFANLTSRGLIIENPTRPHEFYANARMHEIQGDYPAARQDYLKFFAFQEPKVDPHLRFQAFLRVQEGRAGAEAFYDTLTRGQTDTVSRFAAALLAPTDRRLATLAGITAASPDFAPAFYELSQEYSAARLGAQSAADRKQEGDLLRRFLDLVEKGQFLTYFYDQQLAASQVEDARTRLAALGTTTTAALENPVRLEPALANDDWIVNVGIGDTVTEIFVSHSGRDRQSTGMGSLTDPVTGKPIPNYYFRLPVDTPALPIRISYLDALGRNQGPFELMFDPITALAADQKKMLLQLPNDWLYMRRHEGQQLAYFVSLIGRRCGLREVRYAINAMVPNKVFDVGICDTSNMQKVMEVSRDLPLTALTVTLPSDDSYISVQLVFADGTQSQVRRYDAAR